jgi:hypothetical protein
MQKHVSFRVVMCAALLALVFALPSSVAAQSAGTGTINGTVMDQSGAVIPGAELTVKNVGTGESRKVSTNEAGRYTVPFLIPGIYEITAKQSGFADVIIQNILVEVGQSVIKDVQMPVKAAEETVTVTSEAALVETEKFDVSQNINTDQVENLPLNGRRWDNLALLTPGASEDGGFGGISFRGINSLYNNNMVDGSDNNQAFFSEARGRTRIAYGYSLNSIKEFQVQTAAYSAEYGRAAGGVVNAVTKSGSNEYHGDFFYFIRDKAFLARDPISNATTFLDINTGSFVQLPKPDERRQQFGGSISGPVIPEKLFFFVNYDQQKRNFPAILIPFGRDFFNTSLSSSQVSRCTDPNCPAVIAAFANAVSTPQARNGDQYLGLAKLDYQLSENHRISGVFNILRWNSPNGIFTGVTHNATDTANGTDTVDNEFLTVTWNGVLSPTVVNETRFQYGRDFEAQVPNASGPAFTIADAPNLGMPNFLPRGAFPNEKRFQWVDNVSWLKGNHQIKFGFDINHVRDDIQNLFQGGGVYSYFNISGSGPCAGGGLNNFVRDLFTGTRCYSSFVQTTDPVTGDGSGFFTTTDWNFYAQDTWKVRPNLTLNFGLRYEFQTMPDVVQPNANVPETATLNDDTNNFGPRFGFAWTMGQDQKGVLRGGYGLYYGRTQNSSIFVHLFQNGVIQQLFSFSSAAFGPPSCGAPVAPNIVFPAPSTAPPLNPVFGSSSFPTPTVGFSDVAAYQAACPNAVNLSVVDVLDPKFVNPLVHQYDLAYERELPWKLSFSLSYLGSRGNHLPVFVDANLPAPDTTQTYVVLSDSSTTAQVVGQVTVPFFSGAVPRPNTNAGVILMGKSVINSWYHGMVLRVRRRESKGFSFDTNFTWSQARDNGQVAGVNGTFAGTISPINPFDLNGEYGLSDIDIRRRFIANIYWTLPFGNMTENAAAKAIVGGWKVASVWRIQDGRPVSTNMSNSPSCPSISGVRNGGLTCGAVSSFGSATNGRAPFISRNAQFTTPALISFDLRIAREFKVTEQARFEFLWEAFNLFNRTQILGVDNRAFGHSFGSNPSMTVPDPVCENAFGTGITGFRGCLVPDSRFLQETSTGNTLYGARQMQFGVKFSF